MYTNNYEKIEYYIQRCPQSKERLLNYQKE